MKKKKKNFKTKSFDEMLNDSTQLLGQDQFRRLLVYYSKICLVFDIGWQSLLEGGNNVERSFKTVVPAAVSCSLNAPRFGGVKSGIW